MTDLEKKETYKTAVGLFEEENYQEAMNAFKNIRGFLDSDSYIQKCGSRLLLQRQKKTTKTLSNDTIIGGSVLHLKQFDEEPEEKPKKEKPKKKGTLSKLMDLVKTQKEKPKETPKEKTKEKPKAVEPEKPEKHDSGSSLPKHPFAITKKTGIKGQYKAPPMDLLDEICTPVAQECTDNSEYSEMIVRAFAQQGIKVCPLGVVNGPSVMMFEFSLGEGVSISKVKSKTEEISYALGGKKARILAPIPGKMAIGVEVPNPDRRTLSFRQMLDEIKDDAAVKDMEIPMVLGKTISGDNSVIDISRMPHMIIAGTTGSGKSICIHSMISSVLFLRSPDQVRLILIDPKIVEMSVYNGIQHLLMPVVTDMERVEEIFSWLVDEMDCRYKLLSENRVRKISEFNEMAQEKGLDKLPDILVVCDEFSNMMEVCGKAVEKSIVRLASMARAVGIHLVLTTQRPSADVITGTIKANIPGRIALSVVSSVNSKIILDETGAEMLTGKGDMLVRNPESDSLQRIQGPFLSEKETSRIVNYLLDNK